jgi:uncharacterized protein YecE (DUF72 family)
MALERYGHRLSCTEINTSFYRSHRTSTWSRWGEIVPETFRFSVKIPRQITHEHRLRDCRALIGKLADETAGLGPKLAVFLVQLPPTLVFDPDVASAFFEELRAATAARIVCEPRHRSWFDPPADDLLIRYEVARVAADPAPVPAAAAPGGWSGLSYWRLHGSPQIYRSRYSPGDLDRYAATISANASDAKMAWAIFDNTASSAALGNALGLQERLSRR